MWAIIAGIVFALSLSGNAIQHQKIQELKTEVTTLEQLNEHNVEQVKIAAEAARNNAQIIDDVSTDLTECVERYKEQQAIFNAVERRSALAVETLESRLADSELSSCRVPDWLVDEVTGSSDSSSD